MKRLALVLCACGPPAVVPPVAKPPVIAAPSDAAEPSQEARLAAIQKAMNDLSVVAQQCWAKVATERFDIEGEIEASIEIQASGPATVAIDKDTTHSDKLVRCMRDVLAAYPWAPPLRGQAIRLPFKWRAPDGQNVIERNLVAWNGQSKVSVAVLLDENNTGNAAASMFAVGIEAGASTGMRRAERAELWYFQSWKPDESPELDVAITAPKLAAQHVVAGDMMYVPAGAVREVSVTGGTDKYHSALRAVVVVVPGGREGTARSGALPTPEVTGATTGATAVPVIVHAASVKPTGPASIFVDATTTKGAPLAASILHLAAGASVPEHVHAHETELLYVWSIYGAETRLGTLTVAGVAQEVTDSSVIQIPPNTKHMFAAKNEVFALQIYTPAGPEQRFKK